MSLPITSTLLFSVDDPCNTSIKDERGRVVYTVKTERRIGKNARSDIRVTTFVYDEFEQLLAELEWKDISSDVVMLRSEGMERTALSRWLKKHNSLFSSYTASFKDHLGRNYRWDKKGLRQQFRLIADDASNEPVAFFERAQPYGIDGVSDATPSRLHLTARAEEIRDMAVLSFLFIEKDRRRNTYMTQRMATTRANGASF